MKQWVCVMLSGILMAFSAFYEDLPRQGLAGALNVFLGLQSAPAFRTVEVDLEAADLTVEAEMPADTPAPTEAPSIPAVERPAVLIYHTHTDEAYLKGDQDYIETSVGRTMNADYSVVSVGDTLSDALQTYGFRVIHDTTDHVSGGFNQAYEASLRTIKRYIGQTDIFIDLHRDAYYGQSPHTVTQNGTEYARMCFVVAKGTQYSDPPHWEANQALAQKLTDQINALCPGVARPLIFKDKRFNQHVGDACLLIEMGDEENTLEQVKNTARLVADAFDRLWE